MKLGLTQHRFFPLPPRYVMCNSVVSHQIKATRNNDVGMTTHLDKHTCAQIYTNTHIHKNTYIFIYIKLLYHLFQSIFIEGLLSIIYYFRH